MLRRACAAHCISGRQSQDLTDDTNLPPEPPEDVPAGAAGPLYPPVTIEDEMRRSYLDYAMSVIVSRALPDVRDGLKPVHRRIFHSMNENGYSHDKAYRKSARIVGDVLGKYHPHGDQSVYDAMVRMAQDFSMRLPLIDGQGNFGSMDNDPPAAMRYTEARLALAAEALLDDLDKDTVDFVENYDGSEREPTVLPARFPNLLVNGAGGIAVGMATNIPPHNLGEVIDACCEYVDNPGVTDDRLLELVPGPDFPTGGLILGRSGASSAARTGRGSVVMRGKVHFEDIRKDRRAIVITEIPFQVNKAGMVEKISEMVRNKRIEGISEMRDESDRHGIRVVIELKREAVPEVVLNQLYKFTPLQTSFGVNALALNGGRPMQMTLKEMIAAFIEFRAEVITRRTRFLLSKARDRAHVLVGLAIAVANIDEVIALIRAAPDTGTARQQLMDRDWPAADVAPLIELVADPSYMVVDGKYRLSDTQARAILDLRLARLTALGRDEIGDELKSLAVNILDYLETLRSHPKLMGILRAELVEMKTRFATPRRTAFEESEFDFEDEDLITPEDMVVTVTNAGYVKRVPLNTYRAQHRGGKGRSGMSTRDADFVTQLFVVNTHTPLLVFSDRGIVFKIKVWKLPVGSPTSLGRPLINMLPLQEGEGIATIMPLPEDESSWGDLHVMFVTSRGSVRRNTLGDFTNVMSNGKIAMKLEDGNRLIAVQPCTDDDDIMLSVKSGKCIRFSIDEVRVFVGRSSEGVRGMRLAEGDEVISMSILRHNEISVEERDAYLRAKRRDEGAPMEGITPERFAELEAQEQYILSVTENGFGKRTSAYEYRVSGRDGQGIIDIETSGRNGSVVASFPVDDTDEIMLTSNGGQLIRMGVHDIRITGRASQGVTLFKVAEDEKVVSVARLADVGEDPATGIDVADDPVEGEGADEGLGPDDAGPDSEAE
jgi:DNA gyrase subunit A